MKGLILALVASLFSGAIAESGLISDPTRPFSFRNRYVGEPVQVSFLTEPDRFASVHLVVMAPNGTVTLADSTGNINSTSTAIDMRYNEFISVTEGPATRTCSQMTGTGINGTLTFIPDRVGRWIWELSVDYYYGSQGYESAIDGSGVCISPPFSRERQHIEMNSTDVYPQTPHRRPASPCEAENSTSCLVFNEGHA
ncbi:hypothetical protein FRC17_006634 [Serendipita sp. 399]|nr:hypothetical protein FRC17_006634 [Serendipita sp. 399]